MSGLWTAVSTYRFPWEFSSPLALGSWFVLAGVPVGIIALYFLKLRRRPVRVPSTILWRRSLEDLHVNSLFQRLRRNLLLFLQLLAVALAMLALAGPRMRGTAGLGQRFVLLIDSSASMSATDVAPTRLAKAKEAAKKVVSEMDADDLAMVIKFADSAQVVSNYTGDRRGCAADRFDPALASATSLRDGLQVAAGLANPSKQIGEGVVASSVVTPKLFIYTDGGFADVEGFSLGNLEPQVVVIGPPPPPYSASKPESRPGRREGQGPTHPTTWGSWRFRPGETKTSPTFTSSSAGCTTSGMPRFRPRRSSTAHAAEPGEETKLVDAIGLKIPAQSDQSFKFDLPDTGLAPFEVRLTVTDALEVDNRAFAVAGTTRKAQVLAVTPGNRYLSDTFKTPAARRAGRRDDHHARRDQDPGGGPRPQGRPLRPCDLRRRQARVSPRRPTRFILASCRPARPTRNPRRSCNRSSSTGTSAIR